jgi:Flp pilus assembly pilin Flp
LFEKADIDSINRWLKEKSMRSAILNPSAKSTRLLEKFITDEGGADMVEYALVLAMVAIAVAASMGLTVGHTLATSFNEVKSAIFNSF